MTSETTTVPNVIVDMTGLVCPHPLLGAKRLLEDMQSGEVLLLKSDCAGIQDDLYSWTQATGNEILHSETADKVTDYYVRKGKKPSLVPNVTLDTSGLVCPGPVVEAKRIFNAMNAGEIMKLVSTCPSAKDEVATWCAATQNTLMETHKIGSETWAFFIRRG